MPTCFHHKIVSPQRAAIARRDRMAAEVRSGCPLLLAVGLMRSPLSVASCTLTISAMRPCSSRKSCIISRDAGIAWVTGGSAACPHWQFNRNPLMVLTSSLLTKRDGILCHIACLPDFRSVSNDRLKFKHTFETSASPRGGDCAVFFWLSLFCHTTGLVFRRHKPPISVGGWAVYPICNDDSYWVGTTPGNTWQHLFAALIAACVWGASLFMP